MNKNYDKTIKDMYSKINTPSYDPTQDVLSRIRVPQKNIAIKRVIIIVSVLCLSVAALGATKLLGWQIFNLSGESVKDESIPSTTPIVNQQNDDPFTEQDYSFINNVQLGESRLVVLEDGSGSSSGIGSYNSIDFAAISSLVKNSQNPMLLPTYIPDGYIFSEGKVEFYLDMDSLESELVSSESKDGKLYEIYNLPENYNKNIRSVNLIYLNSDGEKLSFQIDLAYALNDDTSFTHGASESAKASKIDINGFDKAILIHDNKKANFYLNTAVLYNEIPEINAVFSLTAALHPSEKMTHFSEEAYIDKYSALLFIIDAETLSEEELIKIAESIN